MTRTIKNQNRTRDQDLPSGVTVRDEAAERRNHKQLALLSGEALELAETNGLTEAWAYDSARDISAKRGLDRSGDRLPKAFDAAKKLREIVKQRRATA